MLKKHELSTPHSCLNNAGPDEPVFVLRAKDKFAAQAIRHWAAMSQDEHGMEKCNEARALADEMEDYRNRNFPEAVPTAPIGYANATTAARRQ